MTAAAHPLPGRAGNSRLALALLYGIILLLYLGPFTGNELVYLPAAYRFWHPAFLAHDWTFAAGGSEHYVFNFAVGGLMTILPMEVVGWIGRLICWLLLAHALLRLGRAFGLGPMGAVLGVTLWLVAGQSLVGSETLFPTFEAKTVAWILLLYALVQLLERRYDLAAILAGLSFTLHPSVGLQGGAAMGLAVLVTSPPRRTFRFALLTLLAALPGLVAILPLLGSNGDAGQWEFLARVAMPYHLDPVRPRARELAVLMLVMPVFLVLHYRARRGDSGLRTMLLVQGGLWLVFTGGLAARLLHAWPLLQIFPFRVYPVITLLFFFLAMVAAFRTWRTVRPPAVLLGTAVVLLLWMPNPVPALWRTLNWCRGRNAGGYCQGWGVQHDELARTFEWIRANTPEGSVVLAPPWRKDVFYRMQRGTVASWHQIPYGRVAEWRRRLENMLGRFNEVAPGQADPAVMADEWGRMGEEKVVILARRYGADYLVSEAAYALRAAHREGRWTVYELR